MQRASSNGPPRPSTSASHGCVEQFLQATINGLLQGGLYALVGVGFSLVWGVIHVVNIAHGAFVILGAYVAWKLDLSLIHISEPTRPY